MSSSDFQTRSALGIVASVGNLYDARSDSFPGLSIFKKRIPQDAISLPDSHFSDIHLVLSDDICDKFSKLDVTAELQASVLAGLLTLEGSGRYLSDQKTSARTVKMSLMCNIRTKEENLNVYHEALKDAFSMEAIDTGAATHVVTGISWGANSVLSCFYENKESRDTKVIQGRLEAHMQAAFLALSGDATVDIKDRDDVLGITFDIRVYGDILPKGNLPTTTKEALLLMKEIPTLIADSNSGKGKPLTYQLMPLTLLKKYLAFTIPMDALAFHTVAEVSLMVVVQVFDDMAKARQELNDFCEDVQTFSFCVKVEDVQRIMEARQNLELEEISLRTNLASLLTKLRSGKADLAQLKALIDKFKGSSVSPEKVAALLATWSGVISKLNLVKALVLNGANYIGYGKSLDDELLQDFDFECFILFLNGQSSNDHSRWKGNREIFFEELKKQKEAKAFLPIANCPKDAEMVDHPSGLFRSLRNLAKSLFRSATICNEESYNSKPEATPTLPSGKAEGRKYYAVDCDIFPNLMPLKMTSSIQVQQYGHVLTDDLLADQEKAAKVPLAQPISGRMKQLRPPKLRWSTSLRIRCTGNTCNATAVYRWSCKRCLKTLEYGFDEYVYCDCGKAPVHLLEFKCTDVKHGPAFEKQEDKYLDQMLGELKPDNPTDSFRWIPKAEVAAHLGELTPACYGSWNNTVTYIARLKVNGSRYLLGKYYRSRTGDFDGASVPINGVEIKFDDYEVLYTPPGSVEWVYCGDPGSIPDDAISVGDDPNAWEPTIVGKVNVEGGQLLGKVVKRDMKCYVGWYGREVMFDLKYTYVLVLTEIGKSLLHPNYSL